MFLCQICSNFTFASLHEEDYRHHPSLDSLKQSAQSGCELCQIFYECLFDRIRDVGEGANSTIWVDIYPNKFDKILGRIDILRIRSGASQQLINGEVEISASQGKGIH
jgi:hypothetical protein